LLIRCCKKAPYARVAELGAALQRRWRRKFAASFAERLQRRRPRPGDKWHMDEVFIRIQGVQHYFWRAVAQDGVVLDILVQARRDAQAAKRFFRRLLMGLQYEPRVIVTDKLRSYGAAQRQMLPGVEHRQSRYLNNRAENSHRLTRRRERQMQRFKSPRQAQDFLSATAFIYGRFRPRRHQLVAPDYRDIRSHVSHPDCRATATATIRFTVPSPGRWSHACVQPNAATGSKYYIGRSGRTDRPRQARLDAPSWRSMTRLASSLMRISSGL